VSRKETQRQYCPQVKVLQTDFADMRSGQRMAIGTPDLIAEIIKTSSPGEDWSLTGLRKRLAKTLKADVACPVTTSIFLRMAVEAEVGSGRVRYRFPFWRVISPAMPIFKRLTPAVQKTIVSKRAKEGLVNGV
jgi:hypothetical protein